MGTLRKDLDDLLNRVWNAAIAATLETASGDIDKLEEWMKRKRNERPPLRPAIPNIATPEPKTPRPERLQPRFSPRPLRPRTTSTSRDSYGSSMMSPHRTSSRTPRNAASPGRNLSSVQSWISLRNPSSQGSFPPGTSSLPGWISSPHRQSSQGSFPPGTPSSPGRISTPRRLPSQGSSSSAQFYNLRRPMSQETVPSSSPTSSEPIIAPKLRPSVSKAPNAHMPESAPRTPLSSVLAALSTFTSERHREFNQTTPRWRY
eukprot:GEMP01057866.1.p1 GENE.GEMP01057866.1~~GEMP01057866.1.p1  ORF type:complete len:260 (+),score=27.57 GEMP01057866.1:35-814(+)